jgi:hypothetical protein
MVDTEKATSCKNACKGWVLKSVFSKSGHLLAGAAAGVKTVILRMDQPLLSQAETVPILGRIQALQTAAGAAFEV